MKNIILISGHARNGKDTLAKYLKQRLEIKGNKVLVDHLAKYIKGYCYQNGWDGIKDKYWRSKLQVLGTDIIKEELNMKNFHAKRLAEDFEILDKAFGIDYFLVPDVRFRDELYYLKSAFPDNVITVKTVRLGNFDDNLTEEQKKHKSETDLNDVKMDYTIYSQTVCQLYDECDRVLKNVLNY